MDFRHVLLCIRYPKRNTSHYHHQKTHYDHEDDNYHHNKENNHHEDDNNQHYRQKDDDKHYPSSTLQSQRIHHP